MNSKDIKKINTLGALKQSSYESRSIKEEIRANLIHNLQSGHSSFSGIIGFEDTVIPDIERALLSQHNILLLGLRGQAKTRIARMMTGLLDEYMPVVSGSEINDDPLNPLSRFAIELIAREGDNTPIDWVHRDDRFVEKLATPDVSVADLIGDVDPIKAANLKLPYSDQRVIHFGLVPRAHRSIFVINELPDLQARIQVSLFNILQEGDLQIRGFKLRLPLDIQFIFTANPEDYTNRGSIVTPLKDRIESQILTHYPKTIPIAKEITQQEASIGKDQASIVHVPQLSYDLLEIVSFKARESEFIDEKSGVSARLSISALENLVSTAERRALMNKDKHTTLRLTDFWGIIPALTGKVELVYEGEQEGPYAVALHLIGAAMKDVFLENFPHPEQWDKGTDKDPYGTIRAFFSGGNSIDLLNDDSEKSYQKSLDKVAGLEAFVSSYDIPKEEKYFFMELVLHGLSEFDLINKSIVDTQIHYEDPLANMLDDFQ